jgi:bifunctional non-homologous end joining protein LigD
LRSPARGRKTLLAEMLPDLPRVKLCEHIQGQGKELFRAAGEMGLEGIVAKHRKSLYRPGRQSKNWQKIKHRRHTEVVIGGFTDRPASLLVGLPMGHGLAYAGQIEYGFSGQELRELGQLLTPLHQDRCPFSSRPKIDGTPTWVKPVTVCEVAFQEWTAAGQLRHPSFIGLRTGEGRLEWRRLAK